MNSFFEHSRHLEKWGIPASTLQLTYGDVSPYTEAAGSTGVVDSDSSCPIVMVCMYYCLCRIPQVLSEPFLKDVHCGIYVALVRCPADRTYPVTDLQIL